jgi:hypothetical protein
MGKNGMILSIGSGSLYGICLCSLLIVLIMSVSSGSGGKKRSPNLYGGNFNRKNTASDLTLGISSSSLSSIVLLVVSIGFMIILKRINRFDERKRLEADQNFFLLLGKIQLLQMQLDKKTKRYIMDIKSLQQIEEMNKKYNASAAVEQSFGTGYYIENFVLLGTIISDPMPFAEAQKLCEKGVLDNGEVPVQVCMNRRSKMAVIKSLYIPLDTFYGITGKSREELTVDDIMRQKSSDLTHKCGEGFSREYDTWINQKFFWLNTAMSLRRPGWEEVSAASVVHMRDVTDGIIADFDKQCWVGNTSTCKWYSWGRDLLFDILFWAGLAVGVLTAPFGGWTLVAAEIAVEGGILAADLVTADQQSKAMLDDSAYGIIEKRLKSFGAGRPISNFAVGGYDSYMLMSDRLRGAAQMYRDQKSKSLHHGGTCGKQCPEHVMSCPTGASKKCQSSDKVGKRCFNTPRHGYKNSVLCDKKGQYNIRSKDNGIIIKPNTWTKSMVEQLKKYEDLPAAPWNCDDLSKRLSLSWGAHGDDKETCISGDVQFICEEGDALMRSKYNTTYK